MLVGMSLLLAAVTTPAPATCDAKPFTLKKPAQAQPAPKPVPPKIAAAEPKTAAAKPKPKPIADCKDPAKK